VTDDIRALTTRLADEPGSLAFLELAEALRRRGQIEAAHKVARGGLARYPGLADAHDLMARVLSDPTTSEFVAVEPVFAEAIGMGEALLPPPAPPAPAKPAKKPKGAGKQNKGEAKGGAGTAPARAPAGPR